MNAPPGLAHRHIAPHLALFFELYPGIHLDLMTAGNDSDKLQSQVDIQIRLLRETRQRDSAVMQILAPNKRKLVASPAVSGPHGHTRAGQ